jgi:archaellum biogenesis ATPase FlaH
MAELKILRMSDIEPEPINWLWEPYLPVGAISLVQGDGGQGKTTLSLAIAAAVTRGLPLPGQGGGHVTSPANVVIQNAEDSYAQTIRPRLEQLGADCEKIFTIDEEEMGLSYADERIEQTLIKTKAVLLVIDPLQAFWGRANMNAANSVRPLLKQLGTIVARHNCVVLLVGHLHKKGGKSAYRGLGSIDIFATARSVMTVGTVGAEGHIRAVVHNKSNLAPPGSSLTFMLDPATGFRWMGEDDITIDELLNGRARTKPASPLDKACDFIENILRNGPVASTEIVNAATAQGIAEKTLQRAKAVLRVYSRRRDNTWYWELPIEGEYSEVSQESQGGQHSQYFQLPRLSILDAIPL